MIVECNRCTTKYRVREDRLPPQGGNIKCPGCAHIFFVSPPSARLPDLPAGPEGTTPSDLVSSGNRERSSSPSPFDAATRQMDASALAAGAAAFAASAMAAQASAEEAVTPATQAPAAPVPEPAPTPEVGWKLKTGFGLVYDFPDAESLQSWLGARDDLTSYLVSRDNGANYMGLVEFPEILTGGMLQKIRATLGSGPSTALGLPTIGTTPDLISAPATLPAIQAVGSGPPSRGDVLDPSVPASDSRLQSSRGSPVPTRSGSGRARKATSSGRSRARGRSEESDAKKKWILPSVAVGFLVLPIVILQVGGVVDFLGMFGGSSGAPPPAIASSDNPVSVPSAQESAPTAGRRARPVRRRGNDSDGPSRGGHVRELLSQAKSEMARREYDKAVLTLTSAKVVAPDDPEVYRLLERVYTRKGDRESARTARLRYRELRSRAARGGVPE